VTAATAGLGFGVEIALRIGQRVRHRDHLGRRITGVINSLQVESEQGLTASVLLDEPIIIPARGEGDREVRINWQTCPVQEFAPFDDRDEQITEMLAALRNARAGLEIANERIEFSGLLVEIDAAIARAIGSAA
jgi:hypothetical protein